ncbi:hypothetical protein AGATL06_10860 [Agathobaculum sp. TL06]
MCYLFKYRLVFSAQAAYDRYHPKIKPKGRPQTMNKFLQAICTMSERSIENNTYVRYLVRQYNTPEKNKRG